MDIWNPHGIHADYPHHVESIWNHYEMTFKKVFQYGLYVVNLHEFCVKFTNIHLSMDTIWIIHLYMESSWIPHGKHVVHRTSENFRYDL